jgi:hypothetical protein
VLCINSSWQTWLSSWELWLLLLLCLLCSCCMGSRDDFNHSSLLFWRRLHCDLLLLLLLLLPLVPQKLRVQPLAWLLLLLPMQPVVQPLCLQPLRCLLLQQAVRQLIQARKAHGGCVHSGCDTIVCLNPEPRCCKACSSPCQRCGSSKYQWIALE